MKILLLGFLALFGWSMFSTHFYVCKIKGLCGEPMTMKPGEVRNNEISPVDTLSKPVVPEQPLVPEKMIMYFAFDKSDLNSDLSKAKYIIIFSGTRGCSGTTGLDRGCQPGIFHCS